MTQLRAAFREFSSIALTFCGQKVQHKLNEIRLSEQTISNWNAKEARMLKLKAYLDASLSPLLFNFRMIWFYNLH